MNSDPSQSLHLVSNEAVFPIRQDTSEKSEPIMQAKATQKFGKRLILAGFVITIAGVVLYCAACFAGGVDTDMGDILFRNTVPFTRATLGVLGLGTFVWLVGSLTYLRGAMNDDENVDEENSNESKKQS